jgi:Bacterial Ig-like domain (group 2)
MRNTFLLFGLCAVLAAGCDTSPMDHIAAAGQGGSSSGGGGNGSSALVVQPSQVEINVGGTFQLSTNAPGISLVWRTSNSAIAGVSATGLVSGVNAGIAVVTATSTSDPTQTASATVVVSSR